MSVCWATAAAALLCLTAAAAGGGGFGGGGEGFIRKYAMMKVYESCLGRDVVRQVQKELRAACQRCNGEAGPSDAPAAASNAPAPDSAPDHGHPADAPAPAPAPPSTPSKRPSKPPAPRPPPAQSTVPFDPTKLQEAILGFKSQYPAAAPSPAYPSAAAYPGYPAPQPFYYPGGGYYQQPFASAPAGYSGYPGYPSGYPNAYPGYPQPTPYYQGGYSGGYYPVPATSGHRGSRDLDLRGQLELLTTRMGARTKNATCVLQELGYLDENLEPNYGGIQEKLRALPVSEELRRDMLNGVDYCRQFAACLPPQGGREARRLFRSKFFFQCYKHKKLEACVMKDVREGYEKEDPELRTVAAAADPADLQDVARDMFDFLSGAGLAEETLM